tara:strand:+ start:421 stop:765 length:345 start_codon:yes stop_codon:yes gene_type:complete
MPENSKIVYFGNTLNPTESDGDTKVYSNNVRLTTPNLTYEFPSELGDKQLSKMMDLRKSEAKAGQKPSFRYIKGETLYPEGQPEKRPNWEKTGFEMTCIYKPATKYKAQSGIEL